MSNGGLVSGFSGAFTWSNAGLQLGNGLISGGASRAIGQFLSWIEGGGQNFAQLFEAFKDQIVAELTETFRREIAEALRNFEVRLVTIDANQLAQNFQTAAATMHEALLALLVHDANNFVVHAEDLDFPGFGIYWTGALLRVAVFKEMAKTRPSYHHEALTVAQEDSDYLERWATRPLYLE
jgi:hypothetical protein